MDHNFMNFHSNSRKIQKFQHTSSISARDVLKINDYFSYRLPSANFAFQTISIPGIDVRIDMGSEHQLPHLSSLTPHPWKSTGIENSPTKIARAFR